MIACGDRHHTLLMTSHVISSKFDASLAYCFLSGITKSLPDCRPAAVRLRNVRAMESPAHHALGMAPCRSGGGLGRAIRARAASMCPQLFHNSTPRTRPSAR